MVDGSFRDAAFPPMTVSKYSSFGTFIDGRTVPHTVAPGGSIVSSISGPFLAAHPEAVPETCAVANVDGTDYYWDSNSGTSMSTPYVAGFIATWLEADPLLEYDDVKRILLASNRHDYADPENPRHGQGWFDPRAGLQAVVEQACVTGLCPDRNNPSADCTRPRLEYGNGSLRLWNPGRHECRLDVRTPAGMVMVTYSTAAPAAEFPLPSGNSPLVLITLTAPFSTQTLKLAR